jgi:hypothetical protein
MANTNENLVYGWSNQQLGATAGQSGYAQVGNAPAGTTVSAAEQVSAGASFAPSPTVVSDVLTNPGYAASPANMTPGPVTAPAVPTSGSGVAVNPSGLAVSVLVVTGAGVTVTDAQVAPAGGSYTDLHLAIAASSSGSFTIPPGGTCKITYAGGTPTWTFNAVN